MNDIWFLKSLQYSIQPRLDLPRSGIVEQALGLDMRY
jgi:hypothetical protein